MNTTGDDAEAEDSDEESGMTVLSAPLQEELYIEDPKKALRGFFEREGRFIVIVNMYSVVQKSEAIAHFCFYLWNALTKSANF